MKIAILGSGSMGSTVLSVLKGHPEHRGLIASDPSTEALTAVKERFGVETTRDLYWAISNPEVKLVFITAPNHAHRELALAAMRAGKAVMLEKPIVTQQMDDGHELRYLIAGTKGAVETDVFRRRVRRWEFGDAAKSMTSRIVERQTWAETEDQRYFHDTTSQALDVMCRVANGQPPFTSARDSLNTMIFVEAAEASANTGKPVTIEH